MTRSEDILSFQDQSMYRLRAIACIPLAIGMYENENMFYLIQHTLLQSAVPYRTLKFEVHELLDIIFL